MNSTSSGSFLPMLGTTTPNSRHHSKPVLRSTSQQKFYNNNSNSNNSTINQQASRSADLSPQEFEEALLQHYIKHKSIAKQPATDKRIDRLLNKSVRGSSQANMAQQGSQSDTANASPWVKNFQQTLESKMSKTFGMNVFSEDYNNKVIDMFKDFFSSSLKKDEDLNNSAKAKWFKTLFPGTRPMERRDAIALEKWLEDVQAQLFAQSESLDYVGM